MGLSFGGKFPNRCTVWEKTVGESGKYTDVKLTCSKKDKQTQQYTTDFSYRCRFIGEAHKKAAGLQEKDKITVTNAEVQAKYNQEKKSYYFGVVVYDFEMADGTPVAKPAENSNADVMTFNEVDAQLESELPF